MALCIFFSFSILNIGSGQVLEAEHGILSGTQVSVQRPGYTGSGFVTGFDADGDKVTMSLTVPKRGVFNLYIRYAAPSGEKYNFIYVNNINLGSVQFPVSTNFEEILIGKIYLNGGVNSLAVVKEWGYFDLDNLRLEPTEPSEINNVASTLVSPTPSPAVSELYQFLLKTYGKVILSGQYGGDVELNRIQSLSGKTPLIRGFDLIDYSPSRVEHGATSAETEKAITWHENRGIVTFAWHWNAPKDLIDQPGKEWWRGFYTEATTFDVSKAMYDNTSEEYTLIIRDIDAIAIQLKKLKDANVPVLWRPLHEAEGAWFWWGAKGPEPCKWLWKLVFDRLVNYHSLDNLIWIWTSTASNKAMEWYPGDDVVDIIGADIYLPAGEYGTSFMMFDNLVSLYQGKKIVTLSENGPIPDPQRLFVEGSAWNWFCTWSGNFITDGTTNAADHVNAVYSHEYVITLDELDQVDGIIASLEEKRKQLDDDDIVLETENVAAHLSYNNPIRNNTLSITSDFADVSNIVVYNAQGKVEFEYSNLHDRKTFQIDVSGKSAGLYVVKVITQRSTSVIRVIKP